MQKDNFLKSKEDLYTSWSKLSSALEVAAAISSVGQNGARSGKNNNEHRVGNGFRNNDLFASMGSTSINGVSTKSESGSFRTNELPRPNHSIMELPNHSSRNSSSSECWVCTYCTYSNCNDVACCGVCEELRY